MQSDAYNDKAESGLKFGCAHQAMEILDGLSWLCTFFVRDTDTIITC